MFEAIKKYFILSPKEKNMHQGNNEGKKTYTIAEVARMGNFTKSWTNAKFKKAGWPFGWYEKKIPPGINGMMGMMRLLPAENLNQALDFLKQNRPKNNHRTGVNNRGEGYITYKEAGRRMLCSGDYAYRIFKTLGIQAPLTQEKINLALNSDIYLNRKRRSTHISRTLTAELVSKIQTDRADLASINQKLDHIFTILTTAGLVPKVEMIMQSQITRINNLISPPNSFNTILWRVKAMGEFFAEHNKELDNLTEDEANQLISRLLLSPSV